MPHPRFSLLGACLLTAALLPPSRGLVARRDGRAHDVPPGPGSSHLGAERHGGTRVSVAASGQVENVATSRSSGSSCMDVFAREWVRHVWAFPSADRPRTVEEAVRFAPAPGAARREADSIRGLRAVIPDAPRPVYPYVSMPTGAQGRVELALDCGSGGAVRGVKVLRGNGSVLLDESTAAFVRAFWRLPGQANQRRVRFIVTYQLR